MEIKVRQANDGDLDEVERLYGELNDYLAEHVNYPRWSREVYPAAPWCASVHVEQV